jgi:hypothetical protein
VNQELLREYLESEDFLDQDVPVLYYGESDEGGIPVFVIESVTMDEEGYVAGTMRVTEAGVKLFYDDLTAYANPILQLDLDFDAVVTVDNDDDADQFHTALDDVDDDESIQGYTNFQFTVTGYTIGATFHELELNEHAESVD